MVVLWLVKGGRADTHASLLREKHIWLQKTTVYKSLLCECITHLVEQLAVTKVRAHWFTKLVRRRGQESQHK